MLSLFSQNKLIVLLLFSLLFFIVGQYAGATLFFYITDIPLNFVGITSLFDSWNEYGNQQQFRAWLQLSLATAGLISLFPMILSALIYFANNKKEKIHGNAKWATNSDLKKSGLFPTDKQRSSPAILLGKMPKGKYKDRYLELQGQTFVGLSAPTGSGKGVGIVIPNLLNYSDSIVNTDIKLENFFKTAGYRRSQGQDVYLFAPDGYAENESDRENGILRSHRWNPFAYVRRGDAYRIGDALILSNSLYPLSGDAKSDVWPASSGNLFVALTLWMMDTETLTNKEPSFPYLISIIGIECGFIKWMKEEVTRDYLSTECKDALNTFLMFPDETQGSILMNLNAPLMIFKDKTVAAAVSGNDFDFRELRRRGITIYVGVQPPNKARFQGLLNLFFEQLINENTRVIPELDKTLTYQCLLLLDEFPALGRVNQIKNSIGFTRQYNLRYMFIYQDKSQLADKDLYGKEGADNIIENMATEIIYPPKRVNARVKEISETLGTKTVKVPITSVSHGKNMTKSKNYGLQKRPLIMPHEIVELGYKRHRTVDISTSAMLFKENQRSFIIDKIIYFEEDVFLARCNYAKSNVPTIPLLQIQPEGNNVIPNNSAA